MSVLQFCPFAGNGTSALCNATIYHLQTYNIVLDPEIQAETSHRDPSFHSQISNSTEQQFLSSFFSAKLCHDVVRYSPNNGFCAILIYCLDSSFLYYFNDNKSKWNCSLVLFFTTVCVCTSYFGCDRQLSKKEPCLRRLRWSDVRPLYVRLITDLILNLQNLSILYFIWTLGLIQYFSRRRKTAWENKAQQAAPSSSMEHEAKTRLANSEPGVVLRRHQQIAATTEATPTKPQKNIKTEAEAS